MSVNPSSPELASRLGQSRNVQEMLHEVGVSGFKWDSGASDGVPRLFGVENLEIGLLQQG